MADMAVYSAKRHLLSSRSTPGTAARTQAGGSPVASQSRAGSGTCTRWARRTRGSTKASGCGPAGSRLDQSRSRSVHCALHVAGHGTSGWWRTGWMAARWPILHLEPTTVWVSPRSSPQASLLGPRHSQSGQRHTAVHAAKTFTTMPDRRRYRPSSASEGRPARGRAWRRTRMQAGLGRQGRGCARLSEPTAHPSMASALLLLRTSPTPSRHLTPSAAHLHFAHGALWRTHCAKRC